jgi:HK97 family phage prohead protease
MSYVIVDLDGTLILDGDRPNQPLIDRLNSQVMDGEAQIIIVSARPIERLEESRAWLQEHSVAGVDEVYLNDFEGAGEGPNVGLAFKRAKYEKLIEEYGVGEIAYVVDNDADVRDMARSLSLIAFTPDEAAAMDTTADESTDDVPESDTADEQNNDRSIAEMSKNYETRALPMSAFTLSDDDGQKVFTGYAAMFNQPSSGLPFTEVIRPGAFKRSLSRVAQGQKVISFLFGHDEMRALATTASGRLSLSEDEVGLKVEARLDPADPDAQKVLSMLKWEPQSAGMSFAFYANKDAWDGETREILEANTTEVSILSVGQSPAYPATIGLSAVRKISQDRLGVDAEALMTTLESVKAGNELTEAEVEVIDTVRTRLAPKRSGIDPTIAAAQVLIARLRDDAI